MALNPKTVTLLDKPKPYNLSPKTLNPKPCDLNLERFSPLNPKPRKNCEALFNILGGSGDLVSGLL